MPLTSPRPARGRRRPRALGLALAGALAVTGVAGLSGASAAPAGADAAQLPGPAVPGGLRTGFELSGGAAWTTLEQEQGFLQALDASSRRLTVTEVGRTAQDRPLQLVAVGAPAPASAAAIARGSSVLFSCTQHGDEPSGREACLSLARDLATTTDRATLEFLRRTTVLFVPTVNPDGVAANTRQNSEGVDVNRDHVLLRTAEARLLAQLQRDLRPDVLHDLHEYGTTPGTYDRDLIALWPRNRNVDPRVHELSQELTEQEVLPAVEEGGNSTGIYGYYYDADGNVVAQQAGDGQERILRNTAGLRHSLGILVEASDDPADELEQANPALLNQRRVSTQITAARATLGMVAERRAEIADATAASAIRSALERGPVSFAGADNALPAPDQVDLDPPCGYRLSAQQAADAARTLALQGVRTQAQPDGTVYVPAAQEARDLVHLLLDERAQEELTVGEPVDCA
ncbi:M14 family zinc carboxypeptidase [Kineococcus sp. SYSU DK005]|uniref:M14 family zinc carboxypeptidase n=1 Tax=Kineococcus sp. SYSU DK005 TaxID=3383126 RepID=UPI003D7E3146